MATDPQPPEAPAAKPEPPGSEPKDATLPQVIGAVFWSFFGIRKGKHMRRDAVTIRPVQVIVVGLIAALLFVLGLLALVRIIIGTAGQH